MNDRNTLDDDRLSNIKTYGLQVMHIMAGDDHEPPFSYSIGLYESYGHPEIIIVGLKQELCHTLINNIAHDIKNGKVFAPQQFDPGILNGFKCLFIEVDPINYDAYVGQAQRHYGNDDFPLLQCIYPTIKGIYTWEAEWPGNIKNLQPILGDIKGDQIL